MNINLQDGAKLHSNDWHWWRRIRKSKIEMISQRANFTSIPKNAVIVGCGLVCFFFDRLQIFGIKKELTKKMNADWREKMASSNNGNGNLVDEFEESFQVRCELQAIALKPFVFYSARTMASAVLLFATNHIELPGRNQSIIVDYFRPAFTLWPNKKHPLASIAMKSP